MKSNLNWQQLLTEITTLDNVEPHNPSSKKAVIAAVDLNKDLESNSGEVKGEKLVEKISELKHKITVLEKKDNKSKTRVKCYNCKKHRHMSKDCRSKNKVENEDGSV